MVKHNTAIDIKVMTEAQRNGLVISVTSTGRVLSLYGEHIWDLSPFIRIKSVPASLKVIDFSTIKFKDGSCLTDTAHSVLLASLKTFLFVRFTVNSPQSGKPLRASTLVRLFYNIRPLLLWMIHMGHRRFADLTSEDCLAYATFCKESSVIPVREIRASSETLLKQFFCVEYLWTFRDLLPDALTEHPWPRHSALSLAGISRRRDQDAITEQIPDRLMAKLIQAALHYVADGYGERLLTCLEDRNAGLNIQPYLSELKLRNWQEVSYEIYRLVPACFIVIDAFSGMRVSEVLALQLDCYYEHEGWDDATYGWLKGVTYKLEDDPKHCEWMVPPIVERAVMLASRVTSMQRQALEERITEMEAKLQKVCYIDDVVRQKDSELLNEMKTHRYSLFLAKQNKHKRINTLSYHGITGHLEKFIKHINLQVEPNDLDQVRNKAKIKVGDLWPIATHQFRKTFARYVARCVLGDVRYLKDHFKHWSLDMTLCYAWNEDDLLDPSLLDDILEEQQEIQSDIVAGWFDFNRNEHLAGVGGKNIENTRKRIKVLVASDARTVARKLSKGYFLRGLGHSWCTEKECRGKGIYSVTECKDCENRVIDQSHIPMWYSIRDQQIELLHVDDCGDPMWQGTVDSLRYAEQVLKDLGEDIETYPIPLQPSERRRSCA